MSDLGSLPDEVLKLVLQHVPLIDRLNSCCLVNRRLHAAAVAATEVVVLLDSWRHPAAGKKADCLLLEWLPKYGQHVTYLRFKSSLARPLPMQNLPCPNLLELHLDDCLVQLGPATSGESNTPGVIQCCTKLTSLTLRCDVIDHPDSDSPDGSPSITCLSNLVHLQHLTIGRMTGTWPLSGATLPSLKHLTFLDVDSLSDENLAQLSALTNLQVLHLTADIGHAVGPSSVPDLTLPSSLIELELSSPVEDDILSLVPTGLRRLEISSVVEPLAAEPDAFVSGLARLQHLTVLHIEADIAWIWPPVGPAYSALTASSNLVSLRVYEPRFPSGLWPHVFPAGWKLPHLTSLDIEDVEPGWGSLERPSAWGAADVASLVGCCPKLCRIENLHPKHGLHVSQLHMLTALTWLHVIYASSSVLAYEESLQGLAAVSQLRSLDAILDCECLPMACLLPLTSLTALTMLCCMVNLDADAGWKPLQFQSSQGGPAPDVWLQLLERCAADTDCQPTALRSLARQLAEQQSLTTQQLSEQQTLNAQQQQQIAGLQDQLSAQQQAVVEQGVQYRALVAGLEDQLQELRAELQQLCQDRP